MWITTSDYQKVLAPKYICLTTPSVNTVLKPHQTTQACHDDFERYIMEPRADRRIAAGPLVVVNLEIASLEGTILRPWQSVVDYYISLAVSSLSSNRTALNQMISLPSMAFR